MTDEGSIRGRSGMGGAPMDDSRCDSSAAMPRERNSLDARQSLQPYADCDEPKPTVLHFPYGGVASQRKSFDLDFPKGHFRDSVAMARFIARIPRNLGEISPSLRNLCCHNRRPRTARAFAVSTQLPREIRCADHSASTCQICIAPNRSRS